MWGPFLCFFKSVFSLYLAEFLSLATNIQLRTLCMRLFWPEALIAMGHWGSYGSKLTCVLTWILIVSARVPEPIQSWSQNSHTDVLTWILLVSTMVLKLACKCFDLNITRLYQGPRTDTVCITENQTAYYTLLAEWLTTRANWHTHVRVTSTFFYQASSWLLIIYLIWFCFFWAWDEPTQYLFWSFKFFLWIYLK